MLQIFVLNLLHNFKQNNKMELKGIIKNGEHRSLTCCDYVNDIMIGDLSLYDELDTLFNQNLDNYYYGYEDGNEESQTYNVRYVILDECPNDNISFDELSAKVVMDMLYARHVTGCYSEWTCGQGGFDYVLNENGHSIFAELESYIGKYVHIKF